MSALNRTFIALERWVAEAIEKRVDNPTVANALFDIGKLGQVGLKKVDDIRCGAAHLFALPSRRDLRSLGAQIAGLNNVVAEIEARLDDLQLERK